jgi:multidrug efflux system outer membrane protein
MRSRPAPALASAAAGALLLLAAGCTLAPRYQRPAAPVAPAFPAGTAAVLEPSGAASTAASPGPVVTADLGWRDVFGDERLRALIALALTNNRDLRVAALNVELVQAQYRIQRAALVPAVNASGTAAFQQLAADQSSTLRQGPATAVYTVGGTLSYELDFFGRLRSLSSAALEQYLAADETRRAAQLTLVAQVATQYLAERAADDQLVLAQKTLELLEAALQLQRRTYEAGRTGELDLRTAESQVLSARFNLSVAQQQRDRAANALVLLVGQPLPAELPPPTPLDAQALLAELPAGLPSQALLRRPDVTSAEHALISANAQIGAARAAFFPSISLTAGVGSSTMDVHTSGPSAHLSGLFGSGSGFWSFVPRIDVPIFRGGALRASLDVAEVRRSIQVAQYERVIQVAFREVADALVSRAALDAQLEAQRRRVETEQRRYELSDLRYRRGVDSYLVLLTAQRDLFAAQQQLIQSRLARLTNLVDLYRALGGGWQERTTSAQREVPAMGSVKGS